MKPAGWELFLPLVAFTTWTLSSFLCHKLAKTAVHFFSHSFLSFSPLLAPGLVTLWQVTTCYVTVNFTSRRGKLFLVMAVSHVMATLATNVSLALIFASSTLAFKLLEPMTSAVIQSLVLSVPMRAESALSMGVIIVGAVIFVGDPLQNVLVFRGVWMALVSNFILGVRNVSIKLDQNNKGEITLGSIYHILSFGVVVAVVALALCVMENIFFIVPAGSTYFLVLCLGSSVCHVVYSYVSTNVILRCMSVVGHAVANIVKRVLVVLLLYMSGQRLTTVWNWAGLVICTAGLLLYNRRKILPSVALSSATSPENGLAPTAEKQGKSSDIPADYTQKHSLLCRLLMLAVAMYLVFFLPFDWLTQKDYASQLRHGHVLWKDGHHLLKENITYEPANRDSKKIESFLHRNLLLIPNDTDQLSPYLTTSKEVISEASRLHVNILSSLIGQKRHAILVGAASFENKGDPAITIGQLKVLERLHVKVVFYINEENCTDYHFHKAVVVASRYSREDLVILMQGGGNVIGYKGANYCRMKAFVNFPAHQTILLSQSVFMRGSESWVNRMVEVYCCKPHLTIFLRDQLSFYIASRFFSNGTRLVLAPDMAFGLGTISRFSPPFHDVLWLKRVDDERPRYDVTPAFPPGISVHVADWWKGWDTPHGVNTLETAYNVLQNGLLFLQRGRVVITERLHGHILATVLDIPHVVLDNKDNKLSSYHNTWTRGLRNVRLARTAKEAVRMSVELLEEFGPSLPELFPGMEVNEF